MEGLSALHLEAIHEIAAASFPKPWSLAEILFFLEHDCSFHWGLFEGERLIAYFLSLRVGGDVDILSFATHPDARRKGHGASLLKEVLEHPQSKRVFLEVEVSNFAAIALYQKHGFQITRVRKNYYEGKRDGLEMSRQ